MSSNKFDSIFSQALEAGRKAGLACRPTQMIVGSEARDGGVDYSKPVYRVDDGACGFAWVKIRPATSAFARHLKKEGLAFPSYGGGLQVWVSEFGQSVERKEAMASAMAKIFRDAGFDAYAQSRLD